MQLNESFNNLVIHRKRLTVKWSTTTISTTNSDQPGKAEGYESS